MMDAVKKAEHIKQFCRMIKECSSCPLSKMDGFCYVSQIMSEEELDKKHDVVRNFLKEQIDECSELLKEMEEE